MGDYITFKFNNKEYRINKALADILKKGVNNIDSNDDLPILIIGKERSGKSKFRDLIAAYMSSLTGVPFSLDDIHFSIYDYMDKSFKNSKKAINSHDEARRDLNVKRSMAKASVDFTNYVSECGSQNQIHIIILPALSDIDKYIALWRAKIIIEIKKTKNKTNGSIQRIWRVIKNRSKANLETYYKFKYMKFKKEMIVIKGRFDNNDIINDEAYEKKKSSYREQKYGNDKDKVNELDMNTENYYLKFIVGTLKIKKPLLCEKLNEYGRVMSIRTIENRVRQPNISLRVNSTTTS